MENIAGYECHVNQHGSGSLSIYVNPKTDVKPFDVAFAVFCAVSARNGNAECFMDIDVETTGNRTVIQEYEARYGFMAKKTNAANRKWYSTQGQSITNDQMRVLSSQKAEERRQLEAEQREATKQKKQHQLSEWRNHLAERIEELDKAQLISAIMGIAGEVEEPSQFKWLEDHLGIQRSMAERRGLIP